MANKNSAFPLRRGSDASEDDFFDIPDESWSALLKRQLRYIRTWVILLVLLIFFLWPKPEKPPPQPNPHIHYEEVDWSRFAYTTYATSEAYLCNSVMIFEALKRHGSKAERVLFYPDEWDLIVEDDSDRISQLLLTAKNDYNVQMSPVKVEGIRKDTSQSAEASWDTSSAKLNAFGVVQYDRVIHLDSDMTVLNHMDELFFLPPTPVAMPRAYWLLPETQTLNSQIVVIEPSYTEFMALKEATRTAVHGQMELRLNETRYDMEILNQRYGSSAMVLPHKQYGLITGEFRTKDHQNFLGVEKDWIPDKVMTEARFVHFSDWPLPKPWVMWPQELLAEMQPKCDNNPGTADESGCRDRELWKEIYDHFRRKRKDVCRLLSYPAPV
ncbi:uncharacterized protein N7469_006603 [Penicillium citrinum]|uniref:Nucleotide-diphospho-sugar transferase n=2 Tax=Penicillium TaxID=5073 RepID=A0A9W9NV30_PENCI|nr:uncharacterized protein N7469_006603 [Penicillium citrinum]KAJ5226597.1 hypothetical protein N7469_006603 [Penicillium citrinum]KAJ5569336.1 hypothetical protein N7450_011822 [Penicillium hetheringtonii]